MSEKLVELTSIKGAISNLILSMIGADKQRALDKLMFPEDLTDYYNPELTDNKLDYIHSLIEYYNNYQSDGDDNKIYQTGFSTFYISNNILLSLLTLNKYVQNVSYSYPKASLKGNSRGIPIVTNNISPYSYKFSSRLFQILKKGKFYYLDDTNTSDSDYSTLKLLPQNFTELFKINKVNDLLNDDVFFANGNNIANENKTLEISEYNPKYLINDSIRTSDRRKFLTNMENILLDFYKWYGMSEIEGLFNLLNDTEKTNSTLDLSLRISLQRVQTEFTTQITDNKSNPRKYLPLSEIFEDIIEQLSVINIGSRSNDMDMFKTEENDMSLYSIVEERIHLVTIGGTAIHSALECVRRMLDEESNDYVWSEEIIRSNLADGIAMMINLVKQTGTTLIGDINNYGENVNQSNLKLYKNDGTIIDKGFSFELIESLVKMQDLYDEVITNFNNGKISKMDDLNSKELDSLGLIKPLDYIYRSYNVDDCVVLPNSETNKFFETYHLAFNQQQYGENQVPDTTVASIYKTKPAIENKAMEYINNFDYQASPEHCKNILTILIKIVLNLGHLYCISNIQRISNIIDTTSTTFARRTINNIETFMNEPAPTASYSILDIMKISDIRENLVKKIDRKLDINNKKRGIFDGKTNYGNIGSMDTKYIVENYDIAKNYKVVTELIFDRMCSLILNFGDSSKNTFNIQNVKEKGLASLIPFTRTIVHSFDEFFNVEDTTLDINKNNNTNLPYNNFEILTNALTYMATALINDKKTNKTGGGDEFTIEDFELFITTLNYHFTTMTTFWSDEDLATINTSDSDPSLIQSALYPILYESLSSEQAAKTALKNILTTLQKVILTLESYSSNKKNEYSILIPKYIYDVMIKIVEAPNLSSSTQYVGWLTCYVISGILMHYMYGTPLKFTTVIE